jgi:ferrous iron transport protein A
LKQERNLDALTGGSASAELLLLDRAPVGMPCVVRQVDTPAHAPEWARWLDELGFVDGERVVIMSRAVLGGDPLVVRVGHSTFALRKAEAACVQVSKLTLQEVLA